MFLLFVTVEYRLVSRQLREKPLENQYQNVAGKVTVSVPVASA